MLQIQIAAARFFNEQTEEYVNAPAAMLRLEHSLISISKWESKWHKSFLASEGLTREEFLDYVRCMSLDRDPDPLVLSRIGNKEIKLILDYIHEPMTATTFSNVKDNGRRGQIVTSELIYYSMFKAGIPIECEKWHLNRLMTLIRICAIKDNPKGNKMNKAESARARAAVNEARRKRLGSKG